MTAMLVAGAVTLTASWAVGSAQPCPESNPHRDRLEAAIRHGDSDLVQEALDRGTDVDETWRDTPFQVCRSLLLRSIWYGQEKIFHLLLERGADPATAEGHLRIPVRQGRVEIVQGLLERGVTPEDHGSVLEAALQGASLPMLDLLLASGLSMSSLDAPQAHLLTGEVARHLVPEHLSPNAGMWIGTHPCDADRILGTLAARAHACEGARGPLWLHFVLTGNHEILEFMIGHGADLDATGHAAREFTAIEIAERVGDSRMIEILSRAARRIRLSALEGRLFHDAMSGRGNLQSSLVPLADR